MAEQTLLGVLMAVNGARGLPPEEYAVSNDGMFFWQPDRIDYERVVARHFVGNVRHLLYRTAWPRLLAKNRREVRNLHLIISPPWCPIAPTASRPAPAAAAALPAPGAAVAAGGADRPHPVPAPACSWPASSPLMWNWAAGAARMSPMAPPSIVGIGLILNSLADFQRGLRNLVRADFFSLLAFYFLTLFEFLFPQANYDTLVTAPATVKAVVICLWAFAGLAVGRHFVRPRPQPFRRILTAPISPGKMMALFVGCALFGYMHMLVAVNFNVYEMVDAFIGPRFSQPWARGRLGRLEGALRGARHGHVPPPAHGRHHARAPAGIINWLQLVVVVFVFLFTLFYGYTSGTRHIFDSYLVTFLIGYAFATEKGAAARAALRRRGSAPPCSFSRPSP